MWPHVLYYIIMGFSLAVVRAHQVFAETGQVPQPFIVGKTVEPLGVEAKL